MAGFFFCLILFFFYCNARNSCVNNYYLLDFQYNTLLNIINSTFGITQLTHINSRTHTHEQVYIASYSTTSSIYITYFFPNISKLFFCTDVFLSLLYRCISQFIVVAILLSCSLDMMLYYCTVVKSFCYCTCLQCIFR